MSVRMVGSRDAPDVAPRGRDGRTLAARARARAGQGGPDTCVPRRLALLDGGRAEGGGRRPVHQSTTNQRSLTLSGGLRLTIYGRGAAAAHRELQLGGPAGSTCGRGWQRGLHAAGASMGRPAAVTVHVQCIPATHLGHLVPEFTAPTHCPTRRRRPLLAPDNKLHAPPTGAPSGLRGQRAAQTPPWRPVHGRPTAAPRAAARAGPLPPRRARTGRPAARGSAPR